MFVGISLQFAPIITYPAGGVTHSKEYLFCVIVGDWQLIGLIWSTHIVYTGIVSAAETIFIQNTQSGGQQ